MPAAQREVTIDKDQNKNFSIEVNITTMTESKISQPLRSTYVVWMETKQNGAKNIGQLNTSTSFFSSALKAFLKTVSPDKPTGFFITAEDNGSVQNSRHHDGVENGQIKNYISPKWP